MASGHVAISGSGGQLGLLARDLQRAGAGGLRRELYRGVTRAARPVVEAGRKGAESLPRRGGLSARVAGASFRTTIATGRNPGVRILVRESPNGSADLNYMDRYGMVRHPYYGHKSARWYTTHIKVGWFTEPATAAADQAMRDELLAVATKIEKEITGG